MSPSERSLLDVLTRYAEHDWVCPSLPKLAQELACSDTSISTWLRRLIKAGAIKSRLVKVLPHGQARIVTICATGKSTRTPTPSTRYNAHPKPAFTPLPSGSPVRVLVGAEFRRRAAELIARDAEERRKREAQR